jgi:uncharacterized protein (DUF433 family)
MTDRIVVDPGTLGGKPVIRGTRVPVSLILNLFAHGYDTDRILRAYPILSAEDVKAALLYSAQHLPGASIESVPQPA